MLSPLNHNNGHAAADPFEIALRSLNDAQLEALNGLLSDLERSHARCDLTALVDEFRGLGEQALRALSFSPTPPPVIYDGTDPLFGASGGRLYELQLGRDLETAKRQYDNELDRARTLVASGYSPEDAWARIRRDALFDDGELDHAERKYGNARRPTRRLRRPTRRRSSKA